MRLVSRDVQYDTIRILILVCAEKLTESQLNLAHGTKSCNPSIERVQALATISRSVLCCHSNETRALISNSPNSAQLGGAHYNSPKLYPPPCSSVGMRRETDRITDRHTDGRDHYTFRLGYASREM